ncbi:MAG: 4a-hydroxytetrahydrobiopterin dehydratase [Granulosicoccus sp.]|nr:4a-hydroxytetrahydrobiopterin dehydratase [Granulosicoccus sp.]
MKPGRQLLSMEERQELLASLHPDWQSTADESAISRLVKVSDFDQALRLVKRCAALAEQHNHHPDIRFGWGYVEVSYTSHDVHGLTVRDARSARALDAIIAELVDTTD